jgi:demethylmenaquinone methyltransferase/2-methoxy-6-polyprenyl-1,4-benzoquinol methylase
MNQVEIYEILTRFRRPLIEKIINSLKIDPDSRGTDIGCGIGQITNLLAANIGSTGEIIGLDYSEEMINYAKKNSTMKNVKFLQGDMNDLKLSSNDFDWVWSMDAIWVGPEEFGCPAEEPDKILDQLYRILKPGGKIYMLFWTSQKFLPGHPLLEAKLNTSASANAPYLGNMDPCNHVMNGKKWLSNARFDHVCASTFVGDINGPVNENDRKALATFFQMLWENSFNDVSKEDWQRFKEICSIKSDKFIADQQGYYGFYTYTLFQGTKT